MKCKLNYFSSKYDFLRMWLKTQTRLGKWEMMYIFVSLSVRVHFFVNVNSRLFHLNSHPPGEDNFYIYCMWGIKVEWNNKRSFEVTFNCNETRCRIHYPMLHFKQVSNEYSSIWMNISYVWINGWQLAKMKKSFPDMSLPWNL